MNPHNATTQPNGDGGGTDFLQAMATSAADMIVLLDAEGRRLYANHAFIRMFGSEAAQKGVDSFASVHPEDRDRMRDVFTRVLADGTGTRAEYRIVDREGRIRYLESQSNVIIEEGQRQPYVVVVSRETTERHEAEEALNQQKRDLESRIAERNRELEAALAQLQAAHAELLAREADARRTLDKERELNELKLRFVSMTSHEFRTPLTMIHSSVQLLTDYDGRLDKKDRSDILGDIRNAVARMTLMLDEVLTISRADAGKLEFQPRPLKIVAFCRGLVSELERSCLQSHLLVLDAPESECECAMDERLLRLILTNLLTNAIKYSAQGSRVELRLALTPDETCFEVLDEGIGIPEKERARMFETFYRASNVGPVAGTGLGLAIVRRAVQRHGGTITCTTNGERGSCFSVRIPRSSS